MWREPLISHWCVEIHEAWLPVLADLCVGERLDLWKLTAGQCCPHVGKMAGQQEQLQKQGGSSCNVLKLSFEL